METFTGTVMAPTMPELGRLESIGAVTTMYRLDPETSNFADYQRFQKASDKYTAMIFQMNGHVQADEFWKHETAKREIRREQDRQEDEERNSRRAAFQARFRRLFKFKFKFDNNWTTTMNRPSCGRFRSQKHALDRQL